MEFIDDDLNDRAASLTYFGILSIFPGLLVLVAGVGLFGTSTTDDVVKNLRELPGPAREIIATGVENLQDNDRTAGCAGHRRSRRGVLVGHELCRRFHAGREHHLRRARGAADLEDRADPAGDHRDHRHLSRASVRVSVVFTGKLAQAAGRALGIEQQTVRLFDIVKWPVLVVGVGLLIALLYWAAPNARQGGFRWITPGSVLAVFTWLVASAGFAFYIAKFDSYNRTYGALGGVIIFLVWLWLTNVAILLGAEFDAELQPRPRDRVRPAPRQRAIPAAARRTARAGSRVAVRATVATMRSPSQPGPT